MEYEHFRIGIVSKHYLESIWSRCYKMNAGSRQLWVLITYRMQFMNIEQNNKWEAPISFLGEKRKKETSGGGGGGGGGGGDRVRIRPCVELSPSLLLNTVYQRIKLRR